MNFVATSVTRLDLHIPIRTGNPERPFFTIQPELSDAKTKGDTAGAPRKQVAWEKTCCGSSPPLLSKPSFLVE